MPQQSLSVLQGAWRTAHAGPLSTPLAPASQEPALHTLPVAQSELLLHPTPPPWLPQPAPATRSQPAAADTAAPPHRTIDRTFMIPSNSAATETAGRPSIPAGPKGARRGTALLGAVVKGGVARDATRRSRRGGLEAGLAGRVALACRKLRAATSNQTVTAGVRPRGLAGAGAARARAGSLAVRRSRRLARRNVRAACAGELLGAGGDARSVPDDVGALVG